MQSTLRIGNGCGFWGDNLDAPILLARDGRLDVLTLEYLKYWTVLLARIRPAGVDQLLESSPYSLQITDSLVDVR